MLSNPDDLIQDILVDSELAKTLVPNKFKHTSKQGRVRRQKLLLSAQKLGKSRDITTISLAEVCKEAGIPRASAYHFFPNVESIFLALRFLNYMEAYQSLEKIDVSELDTWHDYIAEIISQSVELFNLDPIKMKLMYCANLPDFDVSEFEDLVDINIIETIVEKVSNYYDVSEYEDIHEHLLITYVMIHSIFSLSFKKYNKITEKMANEALLVSKVYLRCHLPEHLPRKS